MYRSNIQNMLVKRLVPFICYSFYGRPFLRVSRRFCGPNSGRCSRTNAGLLLRVAVSPIIGLFRYSRKYGNRGGLLHIGRPGFSICLYAYMNSKLGKTPVTCTCYTYMHMHVDPSALRLYPMHKPVENRSAMGPAPQRSVRWREPEIEALFSLT